MFINRFEVWGYGLVRMLYYLIEVGRVGISERNWWCEL